MYSSDMGRRIPIVCVSVLKRRIQLIFVFCFPYLRHKQKQKTKIIGTREWKRTTGKEEKDTENWRICLCYQFMLINKNS